MDARALALVLFAGEVFPVKHLREGAATLARAAYYNLYGRTETNVCTFARIPAVIPADRQTPYPIGFDATIAVAGAQTTTSVRSPLATRVCLYISGPSAFQGY